MNWKDIIYSLLLLACVSSCNEEFEAYNNGNGDGTLRLIAAPPANYNQTRAADELNHFITDTKFYLYATKTGTDGKENWDNNYLLKNPKSKPEEQDALAVGVADANDMLGTAVRIDEYTKNSTYSITTKFNDKPLNLYGIVAASNSNEERVALETEYSRSQYAFIRESGKPAKLHMSYFAKNDDGTMSSTHSSLPDFMWSGTLKNLTPYNNSGDIIMPFTHVLSKLRFHAIYLDEEGTTGGERPGIVITGLRIKDYQEGILSFANGLFDYNYDTHNSGVERKEWVDVPLPKDGVTPKDKTSSSGTGSSNQLDQFRLSDPFAITRIFPTYNTSYDNTFDGDLTDEIPGLPVASLPEDAISKEHAVEIEITYTMGGKKMALTVPLKNLGQNFAFAPNHEYDIILTLTTTSVVVAIVPLYYEYIQHDLPLDEYELGEPIDFGGVLWAPQNLGATSANPLTNAEAWERSRGFYYQYGRNIPYYVRGCVLDPYPTVQATDSWDQDKPHYLYTNLPQNPKDNINIPSAAEQSSSSFYYENEEGHGARAYPYIPVLWEKEIEDAKKNSTVEGYNSTEEGYKNFLKEYRFYSSKKHTGQTDPDKNFSDPYIANYIVANPAIYQKSSVAFTTYIKDNGNYLRARYWNKKQTVPKNWGESIGQNNESDPCPKGWRLPTKAEFLSIFPYDHCCGDISFNPGWSNNGDARAIGRFKGQNNPFDHSSGCFIESVRASATDGDYKGLPSVYVGIYKDGEGYNDLVDAVKKDPNKVDSELTAYQEGWGTIYCIKCAGTPNAYALRWQVKIVGYDPMTEKADPDIAAPHQDEKAHDFSRRGVIVISKYELGEKAETAYLSYRTLTDDEKKDYDHVPAEKIPENKCIVFSNQGKNIMWNTFVQGTSEEINIDWNRPDGIMYLPIPGYVIATSSGSQALLYPGREALYWAANPGVSNDYGNFATAVRIKFSGSYESRFLYFTEEEYIANGCHVRPVRDTRAEIR